MLGLYKVIQFITDIGKSEVSDGLIDKKIVLINWISVALIILCIAIIPLYVWDIISYKGANVYRISFLAVFSFLSILSNYFRRYFLSKVLISLGVGFFIFIYPLITGIIIEGFFLWYSYGAAVFSILPFLIFDLKKERLSIAISGLFYMVLVIYGDRLMLWSSNRILDVDFIFDHYLYYKMPLIIFWVLLNIVAIILVLTNDYTNRRLQNAYHDIKEKSHMIKEQSDEISAQNEELIAQSEQISQVNASLEQRIEERTKKLEHQNKMLSEYAFINAHLLRSPLSNILGLIYLLKMIDDKEERDEIIEKLDASADKMNKVVRKITNVVEKGSKLTREEFIEIRRNVLED